jgi:GMP synthase-like glutamine amidotransferase
MITGFKLMRFLIFQHSLAEDVGNFTQLFPKEGVSYDRVIFRRGDAIPDLDAYDALWVLGGAMDVWDVDEFPWLIEEKRAIRRFVTELQRPYLGICLGHQLLADALGGTCGPMRESKAIGPHRVVLTDEGRNDPLFSGFSTDFDAMQWHSVRVAQMPEGAIRLARSDNCCCEALRIGRAAWGLQFHPELWQPTLDRWATSESAVSALDRHFGENGFAHLTGLCQPLMAHFEQKAHRLLRNFLQASTGHRIAA